MYMTLQERKCELCKFNVSYKTAPVVNFLADFATLRKKRISWINCTRDTSTPITRILIPSSQVRDDHSSIVLLLQNPEIYCF